MHSYEIEAAIAAGDAEYDFLKRGASDYKDRWTVFRATSSAFGYITRG